MNAGEMAEETPLVRLDTSALEAAELMASRRLPALVVVDKAGYPLSVLPASQVVRFLVPAYVQDDPSLARVLSEKMGDHAADKLAQRPVRDLLPYDREELPVAQHDDTVIEVAALMARLRCPMVAVLKSNRMIGVITASRLLQTAVTPRDERDAS